MADKLLTPQQEAFLSYYTNPKSETFGNARQSALKANYSEEYSRNITGQLPEWLSDNISKLKRLQKAEKVLDTTLDYAPVDEGGKIDHNLLRIQSDVAKFIAKGIGKGTYSERIENQHDLSENTIKAINYIVPDGDKSKADK